MRTSSMVRNTSETKISVSFNLDGTGTSTISTGIPFFDHMLTLFSAHGFFDLDISAQGDIDIDTHHTVEDTGLILGSAISEALGNRSGIKRYGHAVTPMDETLGAVTIDFSNRPFLVCNLPAHMERGGAFGSSVAKEFFQALSVKAGMNLHINVQYGDNDHHILESVFKSLGRAMDMASSFDERVGGVLSTKGKL
jgi:imidazoleglycerol-phosphate dehydratase